MRWALVGVTVASPQETAALSTRKGPRGSAWNLRKPLEPPCPEPGVRAVPPWLSWGLSPTRPRRPGRLTTWPRGRSPGPPGPAALGSPPRALSGVWSLEGRVLGWSVCEHVGVLAGQGALRRQTDAHLEELLAAPEPSSCCCSFHLLPSVSTGPSRGGLAGSAPCAPCSSQALLPQPPGLQLRVPTPAVPGLFSAGPYHDPWRFQCPHATPSPQQRAPLRGPVLSPRVEVCVASPPDGLADWRAAGRPGLLWSLASLPTPTCHLPLLCLRGLPALLWAPRLGAEGAGGGSPGDEGVGLRAAPC